MKTASEALTETLVSALLESPEFEGAPVVASWDTEERPKPCLIVSARPEESPHPKSRVLNLSIEHLTNRDDTPAHLAHRVAEKINDFIERESFNLAKDLFELGWQVASWNMATPFFQEEGEGDWLTGYEYRLVMLQV